MISSSENNAAGQADYIEVVPSRREAMGFAVSMFKGVDASAIDVMKTAEAIHQFLVAGSSGETNAPQKSIDIWAGISTLEQELRKVDISRPHENDKEWVRESLQGQTGPEGYSYKPATSSSLKDRSAKCVFPSTMVEGAGATRSAATDKTESFFVGAEEVLLDWTPEKKSTLRITLPCGSKYLNGFWINLAGATGIFAHFSFLASVKGQMIFEADQWHLENGPLHFQPNPLLKLRGPFLKGKTDGI
ncbi:MAG: hypothetical protein ACTIDN_10605 [Acetobacter sp.]|uniref:hypothetical protein n=1 Tax=Acetobacter sp. TaxID=440 RepID=UPI003F9317D8